MNAKQFYAHLKELQHAEGEMDGFDMAYYDGAKVVIEACGDGGISQQFINGMKYAISMIDNVED